MKYKALYRMFILMMAVFLFPANSSAAASEEGGVVYGYFERDIGEVEYLPDELLNTHIYTFVPLSSHNQSFDFDRLSCDNNNFLIVMESDYFKSNFEFKEKATIRLYFTNIEYGNGKLGTVYNEVNKEYSEYCLPGELSTDNFTHNKGYFEEKLESCEFLPSVLQDTYIYKFKIIESMDEFPKYSDYIYVLCEADYFESNLGFEAGFRFIAFETDMTYEGREVYTLYNFEAMDYFDDFNFDVFDKDTMIEETKSNKLEQAKKDFTPFVIVICVIVSIAIISTVIGKKTNNRNQ